MPRYTVLFLPSIFLGSLLMSSCGTILPIWETSIEIPQYSKNMAPVQGLEGGSIIDEIRSLTEIGSLSSLTRALDMIHQKNLGRNEFGRVMNMVIVILIQKVYPYTLMQFPSLDPPPQHRYTKIIRNAEQGIYTPPQQISQDYLEYVLPFLALMPEAKNEHPLNVLRNLRRAEELNADSVLAPYFIGLIYERINRLNPAKTAYQRAYTLSPECYPVVLGLVRIMNAEGQKQEAIQMLQDLLIRFPDNISIKQELALTYYYSRDWSRAEPAIREILQRNNSDPEFLLMQAHVLVEQGKFFQAITPLDRYRIMYPNNKLYLFLQAQVQAEGYHNYDAAINYLHSLLKSPSVDEEVVIYAAGLLLESKQEEYQQEGRELLQRLLAVQKPSLMVLDLALQDAVRREAWEEAKPYLNRLLEEGPISRYLMNAYMVEHGLGNKTLALSFAKKLHEWDPSSEEGTIAYITAIIDTGRDHEADQLIESHLAGPADRTVKAQYYYLRSRIRHDAESTIKDLRSSLFEDPRNINALIALFEIYHRRKDERRAVYYLKQALSFAPNNVQLQRYEMEYKKGSSR